MCRFAVQTAMKTIKAVWSDDYPYQVSLHWNHANSQKFTAISPNGTVVAIGTTDNHITLLHYPTLDPAADTIELDSELVDLDWGGDEGEWVSAVGFGADHLSSLLRPSPLFCYTRSPWPRKQFSI
jgi:prolactin regulatory element-binding protein